LTRMGFVSGRVADTMLLAQLLSAGTRPAKGFHGLAQTVERELGIPLDKEEQKSDWGGALTEEQLRYAARDAAVLLPLHAALMAKINAASMTAVADLEHRCLPGLVWLSLAGVGFDRPAWEALAAQAEQEAAAAGEQLAALAPPFPEDGK